MLSNSPPLTGTVLVVDDEPALRCFADSLLQDLGYSALLAESGRAAVQLLLQKPDAVAAVLLDMTMPGITPQETFRLLREIRPNLPVIILSGELEAAVRERFGPGIALGYIQKPYTASELEAALAQALGQPAPIEPSAFKLVRLSEHEFNEGARAYLVTTELELVRMAALLAASDFESIRVMGHSLKGSGGCFGFSEMTRIGRELEGHAEACDAARCGEQLDALKKFLEYAQRIST